MPVSSPVELRDAQAGRPLICDHSTFAWAGSTSAASCRLNGWSTGTRTVVTEARAQLATRDHMVAAAEATAAAPAPEP